MFTTLTTFALMFSHLVAFLGGIGSAAAACFAFAYAHRAQVVAVAESVTAFLATIAGLAEQLVSSSLSAASSVKTAAAVVIHDAEVRAEKASN